ncbi:MAG: hypothetical protein ACPLVG_02540 [Pseudothermotoga sp.]
MVLAFLITTVLVNVIAKDFRKIFIPTSVLEIISVNIGMTTLVWTDIPVGLKTVVTRMCFSLHFHC